MTKPRGTADFFALEAGECLERLEAAITHEGPRPDEMLRAARGLRGSALMAGHPAIARAAAGFEGLARALRDKGLPWTDSTSERAAQGVDELRHLVRRAPEWTDVDTTRAGRLAAELDAITGAASGDVLRPVSRAEGSASTGVRAFVAREGALIASALDRAARALESTPEAREPLYAVLRRMQSLRGLAEIAELPPLPEILDGIELAVGDLTRLFAPPPDVSSVLDAGAAALARLSREITEHGRPQGDPAEARAFTEGLLRAFAAEADVVPIESMYPDGDPHPMQRSTAQPQFAPVAPLGPVEMVSYGEHLTQAADRILASAPGTARDLRLYTLVSTFRSVAVAGDDPMTRALARLGRAARDLIGTGAAARKPEEFAAALREAGAILSGLVDRPDPRTAAEGLDAIARRLGARDEDVRPPAPAAGGAATGVPERVVIPAPEPEPAEEIVVPVEPVAIESLAFDGETGFAPDAVVPIEALAPSGRVGLESGFDRLRSLASGRPGAAATAVTPAPSSTGAETIVEIGTLCYSGRGALERAAEIQAEIARRMADARDLSGVEPLVRELLDLVPLALAS